MRQHRRLGGRDEELRAAEGLGPLDARLASAGLAAPQRVRVAPPAADADEELDDGGSPRVFMSSFLLWIELSCWSTLAPTKFAVLFCADEYSSVFDTLAE